MYRFELNDFVLVEVGLKKIKCVILERSNFKDRPDYLLKPLNPSELTIHAGWVFEHYMTKFEKSTKETK